MPFFEKRYQTITTEEFRTMMRWLYFVLGLALVLPVKATTTFDFETTGQL